jgi:hypothetical protein
VVFVDVYWNDHGMREGNTQRQELSEELDTQNARKDEEASRV